MKLPTSAVLVLGSIIVLQAQTPTPAPAPETPPPRVRIDLTPKDQKKDGKDAKADPKKDAKKDAKKKEEPGKIEGVEISRGAKGFMGIRVVDGVFRLTFYDAKKKPRAPDVARAMLRWPVNYKGGDERTVLNPGGDANSLTSAKVVRPPLTFKLYITLLAAEGSEEAGTGSETFVVDFRQ
jgi:hypothetical protein